MNFTAWLVDNRPIEHGPRAVLAQNAIMDKSETVIFKDNAGVLQPPQCLRIEYDNTTSDAVSAAGVGERRRLTLFGVHCHPTLADTQIKQGWRFTRQAQGAPREYTVVSVILTHGEIQAIAEIV